MFTKFVCDSAICQFAIPNPLISNDSALLINTHARQLLEECGIDHVKSSPYYPQRNGKAEAPKNFTLNA